MANTTSLYDLPPLPAYDLRPMPSLIPWIQDTHLALALPVIAYWAVSLFFHAMDELDLFPEYRLHTPAEVLKRNRVTRWECFRDVIIQQIVQTVVGILFSMLDERQTIGKEEYDIAVWAQRIRLLQRAIPGVLATLGIDAAGLSKHYAGHTMISGALAGGVYPELTQKMMLHGQPTVAPAFAGWELAVGKAIYHVIIPAMQFFLASIVIDSWQYFLHRAMHMNKWLYTTFHSRHHRLYVPYAYGALYNHPFEGFLLDTCGTGVAYMIAGMTTRQTMWLFTISTIKTVDDHCGYAFPWDPLQHLTSNNAGYHDVHHQSWGIKTNFSQPFFTFWDQILGTKWTGGDVSARYERARLAAQKKVDDEAASNANSAAPSGTATPTTARASTPAFAEASSDDSKSQKDMRRSPRKRTQSSGLRGLADRVGESLNGKGSVGALCSQDGRQ